jgi:hypothetical protein
MTWKPNESAGPTVLLSITRDGSDRLAATPILVSGHLWPWRWNVWKSSPWPMTMNSTRSPMLDVHFGVFGAFLRLKVVFDITRTHRRTGSR